MEYMKDTKLSKRYYKHRNAINAKLVKQGIFVSDFLLDDYAILCLLWEEGVFNN